MKNFIKTIHLKLNINIIKMPLSILNSIFLFMYYYNQNIFGLIISVLISLYFLLDFKYLILSMIVFLFSVLFLYFSKQNILNEKIDDHFRVQRTNSFGVVIKYKENNIFLKTYEKFNVKDIISVKGNVAEIINTSKKFDLKGYFETQNIFNMILKPQIEIIEKSNDIRNIFREYLQLGDLSYTKITPLVLLGIKNNLTREIYKITLEMNIVHLFVISGFHLSLIFLLLNYLFKKIKILENYALILSLFPVFIYLYFLYFSLSATRAFLFLMFNVLNKLFNKKRFNSIQIFSFTLMLMYVLFPRSIYSLSFIFSFNATFVVLYVNSLKIENNSKKFFLIGLFAYLANFIIIIYINKFISILGLLYGLVLSPLIIVIYVMHLILFWFKPLINFIDYYFIWILKLINKTNYLIKINKFNINFVYLSYGIILVMFIIILVWNSYMEKKTFLLKKKLKSL